MLRIEIYFEYSVFFNNSESEVVFYVLEKY